MSNRIVVLVDMDCFYVQVEERLNPSIKGKPAAVVQYKKWKGGGIIAVNYEARAFGVNRSMRGDDAKALCEDIALVHVPEVRGKADISKYRDAGKEVLGVLCDFSDCVEKASIDEAYIDLTETIETRIESLGSEGRLYPHQLPNTFVEGALEDTTDENRARGVEIWLNSIFDSEPRDLDGLRLAVAGVVVEEMRAMVEARTGFHCSAGIANNKMLSKLACGLHKPKRQTILPHALVAKLFKTLPLKKVRNLGGKLGDTLVEELGCRVMDDLLRFSEKELRNRFDEKTGQWLYNIARGFDNEPVTSRQLAKSIGCSKNFMGKESLTTREKVKFWIGELSKEVAERLIEDQSNNRRTARLLTVSVRQDSDNQSSTSSKSCILPSYDAERIATDAYALLQRTNTAPPNQDLWIPPIKNIGISASKFEDHVVLPGCGIEKFFSVKNKEDGSKNDRKTDVVGVQNESAVVCETSVKTNDCDTNAAGSAVKELSFFQRYLNKSTGKTHSACAKRDSLESNNSSLVHRQDVNNSDLVQKPTHSSGHGFFASKMLKAQNVDVKDILNEAADVDSINNNSTTDNCHSDQSVEAVEESECVVSIQELFPDLSQVDDSVIPLLPANVQKQLKNALQVYRARHVGRQALQKVGIEKFVDHCVKSKNTNNESEPLRLSSTTISSCEDALKSDDAAKVVCDKCGKRFDVGVIAEHDDYHFALDMQNELRNEGASNRMSAMQRTSVGIPTKKRGRPAKNSAIVKKAKSITSFFVTEKQ